MNLSLSSDAPRTEAKPWWSFGIVWVMLGGPAVVVVASIATAVLAYRGHDIVIPPDAGPNAAPASIRHIPAEEAHEHDAR